MNTQVLECDVAVIGGGMGGVAATQAAAAAGVHVVLSEATDWLGGQVTSQGVSALDEHHHIESFGGTRSYYQFRDSIRAVYQDRYNAPAMMPDGALLNPGDGWVSRLCFEPEVAVRVIDGMLEPYVKSGRLKVLINHEPAAVVVEDDRVTEIVLRSRTGQETCVRAAYTLDATELGDLLPLAGIPYVIGAEGGSDTGEAHAGPGGPQPEEVQGFTFCFALEYQPGQDHRIAKPEGYEHFRDSQPFTLTLKAQDGTPRPFRMFEASPEGHLPFWTYRRILHGALLDPSGRLNDIALINWPSNDYHRANMVGKPANVRAHILDEAKRLALGFCYWLQTEVPRDDGEGFGYPGLRLRPDIMGTTDGLSKAPYIRESRRILALKRIVEGEIAAAGRDEARAEPFSDSVGIGWYHLDLHDCVGNPRTLFEPTLPFQIPLGALIPRHKTNLLAACKNIGTTHITNGSYRLHPVEWNIGESAGALAAFCCREGCDPHQVYGSRSLLRRFQYLLLERGVPLAWAIDVPASHALFAPTQLLIVSGAIPAGCERSRALEIRPFHPLAQDETIAVLQAGYGLVGLPAPVSLDPLDAPQQGTLATPAAIRAAIRGVVGDSVHLSDAPTWGDLCEVFAPLIERALAPVE